MNTELDAAFAAVLCNPDQDGPRLAYADACDAHGDRERAEFVRIQLAQRDFLRSGGDLFEAGFPDIPRERELLKRCGVRWAGPIAERVKYYLFFGGFVEKIALDAAKFLATADELFGLAPIRRLTLTGVGPVVEQLFRSPHLQRIVSLNLEYQDLGDRGATLLASSPYLSKLRWLDLSVNEITHVGLEVLARSDKLPALQNLILMDNPVYEEVKESIDDDAGSIAGVGDALCAIEKRYGRKTWLHPVLDHGRRYFREEEL